MEDSVMSDLINRVKKYTVKGVEQDCIEKFVAFHIKMYLQGVRAALMSKAGMRPGLTKKQITKVFDEILHEKN